MEGDESVGIVENRGAQRGGGSRPGEKWGGFSGSGGIDLNRRQQKTQIQRKQDKHQKKEYHAWEQKQK